jgi:hypothetical protein
MTGRAGALHKGEKECMNLNTAASCHSPEAVEMSSLCRGRMKPVISFSMALTCRVQQDMGSNTLAV